MEGLKGFCKGFGGGNRKTGRAAEVQGEGCVVTVVDKEGGTIG